MAGPVFGEVEASLFVAVQSSAGVILCTME